MSCVGGEESLWLGFRGCRTPPSSAPTHCLAVGVELRNVVKGQAGQAAGGRALRAGGVVCREGL